MDSLAELQRQVVALQQQNAELRAGKSQYANQAELLRTQQAMSQQGRTDQPLNIDSSDWFSQMVMGGNPAQAPAVAAPPAEEKLVLTKTELAQMMKNVGTAVEKRIDTRFTKQQEAVQTMAALQHKLAVEHPGLARDHAPVIDQVWQAQLAINPKADPLQLYNETIRQTQSLVDHVVSKVAPNQGQQHPYGVGSQFGAEIPPWLQPNGVKANENIYQDRPGNERPEWAQDCQDRTRYNRSKALGVGTPQRALPPAQQGR